MLLLWTSGLLISLTVYAPCAFDVQVGKGDLSLPPGIQQGNKICMKNWGTKFRAAIEN